MHSGLSEQERSFDMNGEERRRRLLERLTASDGPISGATLARELNVSRQVIVQDIALLRANGIDIFSASRGYMILHTGHSASRTLKVLHTDEETEEELTLIVDMGGQIRDIFIYHKVYGVVRADLNIRSRKDVRNFMENIRSGKSSLLKNVTSGYHYHTILAEDEQTLDAILEALSQRGFLAQLQDYEPVDFRRKA